MSSAPSAAANRTWLERNWMWLAGLAVAVLVVGVCVFVSFVLGFMRSSDAYADAVNRARSSPAVIAALGDPVSDGFWFTGHISVSGSSGRADFSTPLSGPKGRAVLYVKASRSARRWQHDELLVQCEKDGVRIDLRADDAHRPIERSTP